MLIFLEIENDQMVKTKMLSKNTKAIILISLLIVSFTLGCLEKVSIKFNEKEMKISRSELYYSNTIKVESKYLGAQMVKITLSADDERIKFSRTPFDRNSFQSSISFETELGKKGPKDFMFYFSIYNSNLPSGEYKIYGEIEGLESQDMGRADMRVKV